MDKKVSFGQFGLCQEEHSVGWMAGRCFTPLHSLLSKHLQLLVVKIKKEQLHSNQIPFRMKQLECRIESPVQVTLYVNRHDVGKCIADLTSTMLRNIPKIVAKSAKVIVIGGCGLYTFRQYVGSPWILTHRLAFKSCLS